MHPRQLRAALDRRFFGQVRPRAGGSLVGELYVYDEIGGFWGGVKPADVASALADMKAKGASALEVYINSPGGDVFDSVAIYNLIARFDGTKKCIVDGLAASGASLIMCAGDTVEIAFNAMVMVHDPWGMAVGNAADMRKAADMLEQVRGTLVDTYAAHTEQKPEQCSAWMLDETWMDAKTAVERGFCDSVSGLKAETPCEGCDPDCEECDGEDCPGCDCSGCDCEDANARAAHPLLDRYKNTPAALRAASNSASLLIATMKRRFEMSKHRTRGQGDRR